MADPLSITTGLVALLGTCVTVGKAVKDFYDGTAIVDVKVKGLLSDVESFTQVLQMMNVTLEEDQIKSSPQATGHIGNHWNNLSATIQDGQNALVQLNTVLDRVNKSVDVLDGPRKHLRLKGAAQEISMFQQQIRSYRDTIQLSFQTIILWNQVTVKESTDKILPNLDELHESIRRIAFDINARMITLQTLVESTSKAEQVQTLTNLRNCVQSAASVVSSASTTLGIDQHDHLSVTYGSEFGDCFPLQPSEPMLRWVTSNTVYEFEEDLPRPVSGSGQKKPSSEDPQGTPEASDSDQSDSDNDLEVEIVQALLKRGQERLEVKDFGGAERFLRNCLTRTTSSLSLSSARNSSKEEIMTLLVTTYQQQNKWDEAQSILIEKISSGSRSVGNDKSDVLSDMLILVKVLMKKEAYSEALLYGRRALKGYRRMGDAGVDGVGQALHLLVAICHAEGNRDEEEAYTAVLSNFTRQRDTTAVTGERKGKGNALAALQGLSESESPPSPPERTAVNALQQRGSSRDSSENLASISSPAESTSPQEDHPTFLQVPPRKFEVPTRGLSAYMYFANEQRDNVIDENKGITFGKIALKVDKNRDLTHNITGQIGQILGERWKALDTLQRAPYEGKAARDKERYENEKLQYEKRNREIEEKTAQRLTLAPTPHKIPARYIEEYKIDEEGRQIALPEGSSNTPANAGLAAVDDAAPTTTIADRHEKSETHQIIGPIPSETDILLAISCSPAQDIKETNVAQSDVKNSTTELPSSQPSKDEEVLTATRAAASISGWGNGSHSDQWKSESSPSSFGSNATNNAAPGDEPQSFGKDHKDTSPDRSSEDLTGVTSPPLDRWAQIRKNAAERAAAAQRESEEQHWRGYNQNVDEDDGGTSGEETIESRVARIRARVAQLTAEMESKRRDGKSASDTFTKDASLSNREQPLVVQPEAAVPPPMSTLETSIKPKHGHSNVQYVESPPFRVKAIRQYSSDNRACLTFKAGQIITVTGKSGEYRFRGEYVNAAGDVQRGKFPSDLVERYRSDNASSVMNEASLGYYSSVASAPSTDSRSSSSDVTLSTNSLTEGQRIERSPTTAVLRYADRKRLEIVSHFSQQGYPPLNQSQTATTSVPTASSSQNVSPPVNIKVKKDASNASLGKLAEGKASTEKAVSVRHVKASSIISTSHYPRRSKILRKSVIVVGGIECGKTCLLERFTTGMYYESTQFSSPAFDGPTIVNLQVDHTNVELDLRETCSNWPAERIRPFVYLRAEIVLLCFAIDSPKSLISVDINGDIHKEVLRNCPAVPIILVGLKKDVRSDRKNNGRLQSMQANPVTIVKGEEVRHRIGAKKYLECSALTSEGVTEVFKEATRAAMSFNLPKERSRWSIFGKSKK